MSLLDINPYYNIERESRLATEPQLLPRTRPVLNDLTNILKKDISILHINIRMIEVFKDPPITAFRRPQNLRDIVGKKNLCLMVASKSAHMADA
jgi:hypothetical protein